MTRVESKFDVRVFSSRSALAFAVADRVCALTKERSIEGRPLVLGLAAGASPLDAYHALDLRVRTGSLTLSRCMAFCLDEYYPIDAQDPGSYSRQMADLATKLGIPRERLSIPPGNIPREQVDLYCEQYEDKIRSVCGIDFQILGIGRSGHIGFNEPGTSRQSRTRLVQLDDRTRQDAATAFDGLDHTPREAITMGIGTILEAKEIALIAIGKHKATVVRRLVEEPPSLDVPASFLQEHVHTTIYLDEDASSLLGKPASPLPEELTPRGRTS